MKNGKSVSDIREANRALLLECLYFGGPASRKRLSEQTGLTPASVTQLTSQLIADGVLLETEKCPPQNRTGRAEQLIDIDRSGLLAVGAAITEECIKLSMTDLELNLLKSVALPLKSESFTNGELSTAIEAFAGDGRQRLIGIGVSVRGSVDSLLGISMDSYGLLPRDFALAEPLSNALELPVTAENNVRGMLTAHTLMHPHSDDGVVLLIKYGPGVGGALMINGNHFLGSRFTACEVGHICAEDGGIPCVCGRRGCLETLLRYDTLTSGAAKIFSKAETPLLYSLCSGSVKGITPAAIYSAFSQNDPGIRMLLEKPLAAFAVAVSSCISLYDPDSILLCSEVFQNAPLIEYLEAEIKSRTGNSSPRIRFITNRDELGAKGAAAAAVKSFISKGATSFRRND